MAVKQEGSNIVVNKSVAGSVFPTNERDLLFPVLVDGTKNDVFIEGSLYGRSIELRGNVRIKGPVVARGDTRLNPGASRIQLDSGLTVNGTLNCLYDSANEKALSLYKIQDACLIIKGDLAVNQSVSLRDAIVFGSIRAVNCTLDNCIVLGTCIVDEALKVSMSSIGGYASRDVTFEGSCMMLHALGESRSKPLFMPLEVRGSTLLDSDLRYYPAIRAWNSIINRSYAKNASYPEYSRLFPSSDWVQSDTYSNPALNENADGRVKKWILSIGGRISDISKISDAIFNMTKMLKCGFEYEHYHPTRRAAYLQKALNGLTEDEAWILQSVCR
jgi:hypothetical protein